MLLNMSHKQIMSQMLLNMSHKLIMRQTDASVMSHKLIMSLSMSHKLIMRQTDASEYESQTDYESDRCL